MFLSLEFHFRTILTRYCRFSEQQQKFKTCAENIFLVSSLLYALVQKKPQPLHVYNQDT